MLHEESETFLLGTALLVFLAFYVTSKEVGSRRQREGSSGLHVPKSTSHEDENTAQKALPSVVSNTSLR